MGTMTDVAQLVERLRGEADIHARRELVDMLREAAAALTELSEQDEIHWKTRRTLLKQVETLTRERKEYAELNIELQEHLAGMRQVTKDLSVEFAESMERNSELRNRGYALERVVETLRKALVAAYDAIYDAVATEDGLDGAKGGNVIGQICDLFDLSHLPFVEHGSSEEVCNIQGLHNQSECGLSLRLSDASLREIGETG